MELNPTQLYEAISKIGFPVLFIFGLMQGWWVMRSEHELIKEWVKTLNVHIGELLRQLTRAADVAERATELQERNAEQLRANHALLERLTERLDRIEDREG